jgi:hypothetical protein
MFGVKIDGFWINNWINITFLKLVSILHRSPARREHCPESRYLVAASNVGRLFVSGHTSLERGD